MTFIKTKFIDANLFSTNFFHTILIESTFSNTDITKGILIDSNLSKTIFSNVNFSYADLSYANMRYSTIKNIKKYEGLICAQADFRNSKIDDKEFVKYLQNNGAINI